MTILDVLAGDVLVGISAPRLTRGLSDGRPRLGWWEHLTVHGEIPQVMLNGTVDLLNWAEGVDLRGRGGAHFPFARKARAVRTARGAAVVVGNGSESEPASHKDALLMRACPHLVLDGLQLAANAVGARTIRIVVSDPAAAESIAAAIKERRQA
ncbi:MAG: hypothetical protein WCB04_14810, partial [Mycobacteriales bacterium]